MAKRALIIFQDLLNVYIKIVLISFLILLCLISMIKRTRLKLDALNLGSPCGLEGTGKLDPSEVKAGDNRKILKGRRFNS